MEKILEGIRVLDFCRYISGPYAGLLLADMGAEVIRVERPGGEEDRKLGPFAPNGESLGVMNQARNKKGITLNLQTKRGKGLLAELVKRSDAVIENFGLGGKEMMGLDYESLKASNPGVILLSISGFGSYGPHAGRLAFDPVAQAASGAMSFTGFPGGPPTRSGVPWVDFSTGVYGALGVVLALYHRQKTGMGQMIDLALMDAAISFVAGFSLPAEYKLRGEIRQPMGNHSYYNLSDCFQAKDGWVFISLIGDNLFRRFARMLNREDWISDPRSKDNSIRFQHRHLFNPAIAGWVQDKTVAEVIAVLEANRIPCSRVNNAADIANDPQVKAREMLVEVEYPGVGPVPLSGIPLKFSLTPGKIETRAPMAGEHNREVYCGLLGLSQDELKSLQGEGII